MSDRHDQEQQEHQRQRRDLQVGDRHAQDVRLVSIAGDGEGRATIGCPSPSLPQRVVDEDAHAAMNSFHFWTM